MPALFGFALIVAGGLFTWPMAHRLGRHSAEAAMLRDETEAARLLDGIEADAPVLEPPTRPGRYKGRRRRRSWLRDLAARWRARSRLDVAPIRLARLAWLDVT